MKGLHFFILFTIGNTFFPCILLSQEKNLRKVYESFQQHTRKNYKNFYQKANQEYADFIRRAWEYYQTLPAIPQPKDESPRPPLIYQEKKKKEEELIFYKEVVPEMTPVLQPKPASPIKEVPEPITNYFHYTFFGTPCKVRLDEKHQFRLDDCEENTLAGAWEWLSGESFNNVVRDCLELRIRLKLCDWAYLLMLQELSQAFLGKNTNEATLLMAYLFCQSGYQMRLAEANGRLYLLFGSLHIIYDSPYWQIGEEYYYPFPLECKETSLRICQVSFPNEQPLSLSITKEPLFSMSSTADRYLQARDYPKAKAHVHVNKNLLDFMETYPASTIGKDMCSRWALYANTPLSKEAQKKLYPALRKAIEEKTEAEAANLLINFVQTAFTYEYDNKVWGGDRAFFADETLYYPYSDCEDRAILFTRLIRDLLGLKTALVYYPGHLAAAVCFTDKVAGDYLLLRNERYLICDPTYIGAPIGITMPNMNNEKAKVILLSM